MLSFLHLWITKSRRKKEQRSLREGGPHRSTEGKQATEASSPSTG
jgi:hypothetical protein